MSSGDALKARTGPASKGFDAATFGEFAPGAAGNVPTEDLLYMFTRMGFDTGVDLDRAVDAAKFIGGVLGRATPGMVSRAPKWPSV